MYLEKMKDNSLRSLGGQWLGRYFGSSEGEITIDVDEVEDHFEGCAYLFAENGLPNVVTFFKTVDQESIHEVDVELVPFHPNLANFLTWDVMGRDFPNVQFPRHAHVKIQLSEAGLKLEWMTQIGTSGSSLLQPSKVEERSEYEPIADVTTWNKFKEFATSLPANKYMFRGQDVTKRLRTIFHRSHRKDLYKFINQDIPAAHLALTSQTRHLFNLLNPLENGAFWNLIQHHGYPTPLLDWTHSPFVAAFFAFRPNRELSRGDERIRIFIFDKQQWIADFQQLQVLAMARPHFSILEALSIENNRALPQQALSSITNVDDVEGYIRSKELVNKKTYMQVIDLPRSDRKLVLQELSLMGITAGNMMPGLDGACEELRRKYFTL